MKKSIRFWLTAFVFSFSSAAAIADDFSIDWSGPYIGLTAGYGSEKYNLTEIGVGSSDPFSMSGLVAGGTLGYNFAANGFIFGLETDLSYAGLVDEFTDRPTWGCDGGLCKSQLDLFGTARLRIGKPFGNFLPFISGGLAIASVSESDNSSPSFTVRGTALGWTIGGGIEAALNSHLILKTEVLFTDLDQVVSNNSIATDGQGFILGRVGLNYKF
jgi:outer membrane immunogenic protein